LVEIGLEGREGGAPKKVNISPKLIRSLKNIVYLCCGKKTGEGRIGVGEKGGAGEGSERRK
jgi:hypothetical protein